MKNATKAIYISCWPFDKNTRQYNQAFLLHISFLLSQKAIHYPKTSPPSFQKEKPHLYTQNTLANKFYE